MSANIIPLRPRLNADAAWKRYQSFAQRLIDDPRLALNRGFMEQMHLADMNWRASFERSLRVG